MVWPRGVPAEQDALPGDVGHLKCRENKVAFIAERRDGSGDLAIGSHRIHSARECRVSSFDLDRDFMPPQQIGPYIIVKILGRGGMGTVYHGRHETTGDEVALKLLAANYADDDHFRTRFASEVETLLKLDHPNIVRLISYGQEEGQLFFAMELVNGQSFHDIQKAGRHFTWREVVEFTKQICAGLRHAHDRGVIHRDLKPGNLLLTEDGTVKLTDFGIAKQFGARQITVAGGVVGTADFMSPEQLTGRSATIRSDMYSLGAVMYTLLARRPPFIFTSVQEAAKTLERETPTRLRVICPEVPIGLEVLIHRLLEREPASRIGTPQAFAKRLDHFLEEFERQSREGVDVGEEHDSFDIIEGPVERRETFDLGDEVFNQPTAPAELGDDVTSVGGSETDELKLAEEPDTGNEKTVQNTGYTLSPHSRVDYFETVPQAERKAEERDEYQVSAWFYGIALVILIGIIAFGGWAALTWKPDADELYDRIVHSMEVDDDPVEAQRSIDEFQQRFPFDERIGLVDRYELQLEAERVPRRLQLKARLRGIFDLAPMEQDFLTALEVAKHHPEQAREQFQAIVDIYRDFTLKNDEQRCLIAARKQIELLNQIIAKDQAKRREELEEALVMANEQLDQDPVRAREICAGIIELYDDQTWASDLVEKARVLLEAAEQKEAEKKNA